MVWEKDFIKSVRKKQLLKIRSFRKGQQASESDQAAAELHLKEVHFIKDMVQKFDGSTYGEGVVPFLEFLMTDEDVAEVGASATLLILNNDVGLTTVDITVLCSFANSPEKAMWLKSGFTICETPRIISNGFRLSFQDEACRETGAGCIVPEWTKSPTDSKILFTIGRAELPATVIILPIPYAKVAPVRNQLKDLCPEVILFLSTIRDLQVVDKMERDSSTKNLNLSVTRSDPLSGIESRTFKFLKISLNVKGTRFPAMVTDPYMIFQRRFPVMTSVQERQEIHDWIITLAFPPWQRASRCDSSDVFSVLQTGLKTGFPFLINADFVFTSQKEIQLDTAWNAGILSCIPMAFQFAFEIMLQKPTSELLEADGIPQAWIDGSRHKFHRIFAYEYLPRNRLEEAYSYSSNDVDKARRTRRKLHHTTNVHHLERVRCEILQRLDSRILLSSDGAGSPHKYTSPDPESNWFSPKECLQVKRTFRNILLNAALSGHPAPSVVLELPDGARRPTAKFVLVHDFVQLCYAEALSALGVPEMTKTQYETFLMDSQWIVNLPDEMYVQLLLFFAYEMNLLDESESRYSAIRETLFILKVTGQKCPAELVTFSEVGLGTDLLYISCVDDAHWILKWANEFNLWDSAKFMPAETSKALVEANDTAKLVAWLKKHGSLEDVSAENYADRLIAKLQFMTPKSEDQTCNPTDNTESTGFFPILVMQFLYTGIREKRLSWEATVDKIRSLGRVYIVDHKSSLELCASQTLRAEGGVLLPPIASRWSRLFPSPLGDEHHLIVLSDKYLDPHCPLVKDIVTSSRGPDTMFEFLQQSFNAGDVASV